MTRLLALTAALAACLALTGCVQGSGNKAREAGEKLTPTTHGEVLLMPTGYPAIATACHGTTRIYEADYALTYSGPPLAVVPNDPTCQETP